MLSNRNTVIIACAGSGKTTRIVTEATVSHNRDVAIVTYTNNNVREINRRLSELNSGIPKHVDVKTWFGFLLRECARPYQKSKYDSKRIASMLFVNKQSTRGIPETRTQDYYFAAQDLIYSDKIARFVIECERASRGAVTARLREIYTDVFIDECQDLAGWDWDFVEILLQSGIRITLVGDPRQSILSTNISRKNVHYRKSGVNELIEKWERKGLCVIETMSETRRCNQIICDFVNCLWPEMEHMTSLSSMQTAHDGVFLVAEDKVENYIQRFQPQVLRRDTRAKSYGVAALNFGVAKGMECDRVLIVPTAPIKTFLKSGDPNILKEKDKLHVAVTRARHSVAFVFNDQSPVVPNRWDT